MIFKPTEDRPSGAIICTAEELEILKSKGWIVNTHYNNTMVNHLGANIDGLNIGFSGYLGNLSAGLESPEIGYYSDVWFGDINIRSQTDLDDFILMIDCAIRLSKK